MKLTVKAGAHTRKHTLIRIPVPAETNAVLSEMQPLRLRYEGGKTTCVQLMPQEDGSAILVFVLDFLAKGETAVLTLEQGQPHDPIFSVQDDAEAGKVAICMYAQEYTAYRYRIGFAKPHIGPIVNKYNENITRYDFDAKEHPHHRSIWFSHGSVKVENAETGFTSDAVDTWNEDPHHGYIQNKRIRNLVSGDVCCAFTAENTWTDEHGNPLCDDVTTVTMSSPEDGIHVLDVELTLLADYGRVTLGATKEAGPIAVRMDETLRADRTGTLTNAWGAVGENEIWMKHSEWNDYSGITAGGHTAGIAVFDTPSNAKYPTDWHSRNYGLFAPNRYYLGEAEIIEAGEKLSFRYRIVIHEGDAEAAEIREKFIDYAAAPQVVLEL
ncbi:MAG: PmoA family protein [Clostridia bacterium]|nr:PmoA family protein [Clostridia bacterium]